MITGNPVRTVSEELNIPPARVQAVADLLAEGATIPFIARYRKEATGSLDEVAVAAVRDRMKQIEELESRRLTVLHSLEKQGQLTEDLQSAVMAAGTLAGLEDIYLPFKPKRRTRAMAAREKGLEPLAEMIFRQTGIDPATAAAGYVNPEKGLETVTAALAGARDIIAEMIHEDPDARAELRAFFTEKGVIKSDVIPEMTEKGAKFKDYFEWREPLNRAPSHRVLAMRRGEKEEVLNLCIAPPEDEAIDRLMRRFVKGHGRDAEEVAAAVRDAYKRLLSRSMETELRLSSKEKADAEAIAVFAKNLRDLLLSAPLGPRRVMGVDPGFRTGCKAACLDRQGKLLHHDTFYLHQPERSSEMIRRLVQTCRIEAVAVGNGTAGRETEAFLASVSLPGNIPVISVNESGASIYSASEIAREEFPDLDLTVRGAVSIGRRLMDPLSELVKIDPKSIGVGQYQHDVDQNALKQALDDVVISCVNGVGVDLNRASVQLLTYVSGLGPQLARNVVSHRDTGGPFKTREDLKAVKRLGPKAFEQCAGFLRIPGGENPLDASAVHPESYSVVEKMARDLECTVSDLMKSAAVRERIRISAYVSDTVGLPTLKDILDELAKPGRDPRESFEAFSFSSEAATLEDLKPGMTLPGIVTNVTAFGAFVDIGVHQDGLVHVSELADRFVKDPTEVVKVHQKVSARVLEVDVPRKRISLSLRSGPRRPSLNADRHADPASGREKKKKEPQPRPFNNPFMDILGKKSR